MKYRFTLFVVLILISVRLLGQTESISPSIQGIVDEIESMRVVYDNFRAFSAPDSLFQYDNPYYNLSNRASNADLMKLTDHSNPIIRCIAFKAILIRKEISVSRIIESHLQDNAAVIVNGTCMIYGTTVIEYYFRAANYRSPFRGASEYLSPQEVSFIDSLLIFGEGLSFPSRDDLFRKLNPEEKYYNRLQEISVLEDNENVVITLAKYQKPEIKPLIQNLFKSEETENSGIKAVIEYPEIEFYPLLVNIFERESVNKLNGGDYKWTILYQALANYPTSSTLELFEEAVNQENAYARRTHMENIYFAISKYPNSIFSELKATITINPTSLKMLKLLNEN